MINEIPRQQPKTSLQKVTEFMEHGSPMNTVFVMAALNRYAHEIKDNEANIKATKNAFINGASLVACAYDWDLIK